MTILFAGFYFAVLILLCTYGVHRAHLVWLYYRNYSKIRAVRSLPAALAGDESLPHVTIQLPTYNEATVVERLIEAVGRIEYPRSRFEIQVLDDSSDETRSIARRAVERLVEQGIDAQYVRREDRVGYKAGALEYGLKSAKGELVAIFDADFVPNPDFLLSVVGHFDDPNIGMVQTRWAHLNRDASILTRVQALMLDGHHLVENTARFASDRCFNFSGTGGIWRKQAIADAGGWQHDTLTEDLDLSYRAQLAGWKFVYRADVVTPAELPEDMSAFRAQQHRWAKGTVQTARKLLGRISRSDLTFGQRSEAFFHMTPHFAYPLMMLLSVALLPALLLLPAGDTTTLLIVDLPLCLGATGSLLSFFITAERAQGRSAFQALAVLPAIIAMGAGMSPYLSKAVWDGLNQMSGEFVRTPKRGAIAGRYRQVTQLPYAELVLMLVSASAFVAAIMTGHWLAAPFALLFAVGYGSVAYLTTSEQLERRRDSQRFPIEV